MQFTYAARDYLGTEIDGEIESPSLDAARDTLRKQGLSVVSIEEEEAGSAIPFLSPGVGRTEISYFTAQLSVMIDTGIPLASALDTLAENETNAAVKDLISQLKAKIETGEDFSHALAAFPKYFDETYIALVRASEKSGQLGPLLERLANSLRSEIDTRQKVRGALTYPAVMVVVAVGVLVFLLTYVMPKFQPLFEKRGTKLPITTRCMMAVSESMLKHGVWWIVGTAVAVAATVWFVRSKYGKHVIDYAKIHAPILGPMFRKVALSRSICTLASMLRAGVSMVDAIRLTAAVAGNALYAKVWLRALDQVIEGEQLGDALRGNALIPPTLVQMIVAGERTGRLDAVLEKVGGFYDREVETSIKTATTIIEPAMIVVMGVVVGGIAVSLLLPIFSLSKPV